MCLNAQLSDRARRSLTLLGEWGCAIRPRFTPVLCQHTAPARYALGSARKGALHTAQRPHTTPLTVAGDTAKCCGKVGGAMAWRLLVGVGIRAAFDERPKGLTP